MKIIEKFFNEETLVLIQECYLNNFEKGDWIHGYSFYEKKGVKQNLVGMGSTLTLVFLGFVLLLTLTQVYFINRKVHYS